MNRLSRRFLALSLVPLFALSGCSKKSALKAVKASRVDVETTVSTITSGTIDAEQQAVLGFSLAGRVARLNARLGDKVKQGTVIAELDNADLRTTAADAEAESKRADELFKEGLVSKSAFDDAKRAFEVARSNYEKSIIRAPFDGMVAELNIELGELASVSPTKAPVRLVDSKPRLVKGEIDEIDLAKVKAGAKARIKIMAVRPQPFGAEVTKVIPFIGTAREQDRSAHIELKFTEATEFVPVGASADIEIVVEAKKGTLGVPSRSVFGSGTNRYVFVQADGKLRRVPVKLGVGNYDRSEILEGLKEGDVVILPGDDAEFHDGQKAQAEIQPWP